MPMWCSCVANLSGIVVGFVLGYLIIRVCNQCMELYGKLATA